MNFKVNFQKAKRNYMVLTFDDEREENGKIVEFERVIHVGMPKKRVFSAYRRGSLFQTPLFCRFPRVRRQMSKPYNFFLPFEN